MANPYEVDVVNPLQALLQGQQGYESGVKMQQRSALRDLLSGGGSGGPVDWGKAISTTAAAGDLDSAAKLASIQKATSPDVAPSVAKYQFAVKNGYRGSILDFEKDIAKEGATSVTTNNNVNTGEKAYDSALNKDLADNFLNYQKGGRTATGAMNTLNYMEGLTKDPNFYSGTGGELVTKGKQALSSMGIAAPDSAKPNEMFAALSNKLTLDAAGGSLGAQISNSDVKFLQSINPNLATTPEGNREILSYHRKVYERQQQTAKMARDYAAKNGGRIDAGFDQVLQDYAEKNPLFPQQRQSAPQNAPQAAPRRAPDGNMYVPDPNRPGKYLQVIQ